MLLLLIMLMIFHCKIMPLFFLLLKPLKKKLFFTVSVVFRNIRIHFFSIQHILSNCYIIFFFLMENLFLSQLYLFIKGLMFVILYGSFLFLHKLRQLLQHIESICYLLLIGFFVTVFFFLQLGESIYDPPQYGLLLWHL